MGKIKLFTKLYSPPAILNEETEYADVMTKFGEKGSTYRGRMFYSVTTHDEENPKC